MQQLDVELKNTPADIQSLRVLCAVNPGLNKEISETLCPSAQDIVLASNSPEGVLLAEKPGLVTKAKNTTVWVYVLDIEGLPLMPCKPQKAKRLLKEGKAKVVKRSPFIIQLTITVPKRNHEVILGVDPGWENVGFSVISESKELISGTLVLDGKTSERLEKKGNYRKNRRGRLWHREPRFNNRARPEGWLPPSTERRLRTINNLVKKLRKMLPIKDVIFEKANFDIQKIENPEISGADYQKGDMHEYQNMRSFLMAREHSKCQHCHKDFVKKSSHIHHNISRSEGGTNRSDNLVLLHERCHEIVHEKNIKFEECKSYKPNTFMNILNSRIAESKNVKITYGYITFIKRNELGMSKTHYNDAFVIAGGSNVQERCHHFEIIQRHRHNRSIQTNRKGYQPSIRTSNYRLQPGDLIWVGSKRFTVVGMQNYGKYIKVRESKKVIPTRTVTKVYNFGSLVWN